MKPLDGEAGRLLAAARAAHVADAPSKSARARLRKQLLLRVGVGAAGLAGAGSAQAAAGAAGAAGMATGLKVLAAACLVGLASGGAVVATRGPQAPDRASALEVARSAPKARAAAGRLEAFVERRAEAAGVAGVNEVNEVNEVPFGGEPRSREAEAGPTAGKTARSRPGGPGGQGRRAGAEGAPPPGGSSLEGETIMLQQAQGALRAGKPEEALSLLEEHEKAHPRGVLREEQRAARILALCGAGRAEDAKTEAERFFRDFPGSPHAARLRASCAAGARP